MRRSSLRSQAQPDWTSIQILQRIGYQAPERVVSVPMEVLIHGLVTNRSQLRASGEDLQTPELIRGSQPEPLPAESHLLEEAVVAARQTSQQSQPLPSPTSGTPNSTPGEHKASHLALTTVEQVIAAYMQEMRVCGRNPKP